MKSKIIPNTSESEQIVYPILMEHRKYKYVVLFNSEEFGVVLSVGTTSFKLGFYANVWHPATDEQHWKPFEGTIELSN